MRLYTGGKRAGVEDVAALSLEEVGLWDPVWEFSPRSTYRLLNLK